MRLVSISAGSTFDAGCRVFKKFAEGAIFCCFFGNWTRSLSSSLSESTKSFLAYKSKYEKCLLVIKDCE